MSWRALYERVIDPQVFLTHEEVASWRGRLRCDVAPARDVDAALASLACWRAQEEGRFQQVFDAASSSVPRARLLDVLLRQSAPLGLALGAWLQGLSAPGVFEDVAQLTLLALLADDLGAGRPHGARVDEFRLLLARCGHPLHGSSWAELQATADIDDRMFALPAVLLAMSRRSDVFHWQLCAFDTVIRTVGLPPAWAALRRAQPELVAWGRLDLAVSGNAAALADPRALSRSLAPPRGTAPEAGFAAEVEWAIAAVQWWSRQLLEACRPAADSNQAMAGLLRRRSREAGVYHKAADLEGCPLSTHLLQAATRPWPLMRALAKSRYVRPAQPERSSLINALIGPRGPMFRVFTPAETDTLREWIAGLNPADPAPAGERDDASPEPAIAAPARPVAPATPVPRSVREAYFLLQGRALHPGLRRYAVDYVSQWLKRAQRAARPSPRSLPPTWCAGKLRPWLQDQHDLHGTAFDQACHEIEPGSREALVESTLQLAPLIMIDGAWLQGFTDVELACSDVGRSLFETYWDELGNGRIELNHPRIYRNLLGAMGISLPPTGSWLFATDDRLKEQSFMLPVYWLCIGKLPFTFMPEILGMNLAMELSGVADGYRNARGLLKAHGFSTQFVDLHNTIDNVVTGHSAWAADAIEKFMLGSGARRDGALAAALWQRVCTGYASLSCGEPSRHRRLAHRLRSALRTRAQDFLMPFPSLQHPSAAAEALR